MSLGCFLRNRSFDSKCEGSHILDISVEAEWCKLLWDLAFFLFLPGRFYFRARGASAAPPCG